MANAASKLEPFRDFIASERRKKTTYRRIAVLLAEKGVQVDYSTIHAFVKVRSRQQRKVITMLEPRGADTMPSQTPVAETAGKVADHHDQLAAIRRMKQAKPAKRDSGKGLPSFREDAPLERLSDEESRRLRETL